MNMQMEQQRRSEYRVGPGASSLLMIFVALSLTTVGILTLMSAMADTRLTERSQLHINAYYAAAARVQHEMGVIDGDLADNRVFSDDLDDYRDQVLQMSNDEINLSVVPDELDDSLLLSFSVEMYEGHEIYVLLQVPIAFEGKRYYILSHVMQNTGVWQPSDDLELFNPEQESDEELDLLGADEQSDEEDELFEEEELLDGEV